MYGFHRVVRPKGVVPQSARVVDNTIEILNPHEIIIDVERLNLDSTSMHELRDHYVDVPARIFEIVKTRGKMHNPRTNSGGVLVGRVFQVGSEAKKFHFKKGDTVLPLTSLSAIPLYLDEVRKIEGDQVRVKGAAVLFDIYPCVAPPKGWSLEFSLAALDISSIVPQVRRMLGGVQTVLVMGCGKAGVTAMATIRNEDPSITVIGMDSSNEQLIRASKVRCVDGLVRANAQDVREILDITKQFSPRGEGFDLVVNCVNMADTEVPAIIAARPGGTVMFFSMATRFDRAALGTDATGKDVRMVIGNGVAEGQAKEMIRLLRTNKKLFNYFKSIHQ